MKGGSPLDLNLNKVGVLSEKCDTCLLRKEAGHEPATVRRVIEANRKAGSALTCHETLDYGPYPDFGEAMCRGFYDAYKDENSAIQIAERLIGIVEVPPPADPRKGPQ